MEGVSVVLFQYGLAGVALLAMAWVVVRLYNENQRLHQQIYDLQETRRIDAKETVDKVTQPLDGISKTVGLLYDKIVVEKQRG